GPGRRGRQEPGQDEKRAHGEIVPDHAGSSVSKHGASYRGSPLCGPAGANSFVRPETGSCSTLSPVVPNVNFFGGSAQNPSESGAAQNGDSGGRASARNVWHANMGDPVQE